jgi:protein-L-isoaspartate O-methyltransferase
MTITSDLRYSRAGEIQRILNEAYEDEHAFMLQGGDKIRTSWMPFQLADFVAIMTEAMCVTNGVKFLEVGSGVGTKSMVARHVFQLVTTGIEYDGTLATVASQKGRGPVWTGDALAYPGSYGDYDIIWMYRPFRDPVLQDQLEQRVYAEMKPGAVLAGAALEHAPGSWTTVVDDYDTGNRGAWQKP